MLTYFLRRLAGTVPVLLAVSAFTFAFVRALAGDPAPKPDDPPTVAKLVQVGEEHFVARHCAGGIF